MISKKEIIVQYISPLLTGLQLDKLWHPLLGGLGHILMLHRVVPAKKANRIENHQSLEISPERLEKIIRFYKNKSYHFLSLDQLYLQLKNNNVKSPFVVFTFDDGYKDNYTHAYPIFKKHNVPFAIYITTSFPENTAIIWWYFLEEYLVNNNSINFSDNDNNYSYDLSTFKEKLKAFFEIRSLFIQKPETELLDFTCCVFNISKERVKEYSLEYCMTWKDIIHLSGDPLVTIGAHTVNHVGLANRSLEEARYEIEQSKKILDDKIKQPVFHFSYPFGTEKEANNREFELVSKSNYKTACTTRLSNIYIQHKKFLYSLPRISVNNLTTKAYLKLQICGLIPYIKNGFKARIFS
ncbi:MAG: polysaccharide deacetylase family protein [Bacteroidales bacterium]|nr:polysaccharide deacetylase family protein [Bacteroidales bacterium]